MNLASKWKLLIHNQACCMLSRHVLIFLATEPRCFIVFLMSVFLVAPARPRGRRHSALLCPRDKLLWDPRRSPPRLSLAPQQETPTQGTSPSLSLHICTYCAPPEAAACALRASSASRILSLRADASSISATSSELSRPSRSIPVILPASAGFSCWMSA